jgi:chromatin remodeling complex protein RSC6
VAKGKATAAAAPVAAAAPAPAAPLAKGKKAAAAATAATAVATPAPTEATEAVVVPEEVRLEAEAKSITARLLAVRETVSELISEAKRLEKKAAKVQKMADKRRRRKAPVEGEEGKPARVSIFQVPTDISPALCAFMGRPAGSKESRSNVTKFVTTYVKEKNLKDKHDIKGDAALLKLLNLKAEDKLTYFNLQKYLNVHYLKKAPVEATA